MQLARIIAFTGFKGAGKDTAALALTGHPRNWHKIAFADPLRAVCKVAYGLTDLEMNDRTLKETKLERFPFMTPRQILQRVGTEMFRDNIPGTWVEAWKRSARNMIAHFDAMAAETGIPERHSQRGVVCTDFRFPDEAEAIAELGGIRVRVINPKVQLSDVHVSEQHIATLPVEMEIVNDCETAQLFVNKVRVELAKKGFIA
jgi:hypothetical protein